MKKQFQLLLSITAIFCATNGLAQLRLPSIIGSGMVLQQNDSVTLWGWCGPSAKVIVTTSWNNHSDSTVATNMASWHLKVKTPAAGGPFTIVIKSQQTITLTDVMIGEVWVCSGQSNMEWNYYNGIKDIKPELANAPVPNIRFFNIPKTGAAYPQDDVKATWQVCDSNSLKSFSAVGYFFGKRLQQQLNVPIGLVNASWGGTPADTWTPAEVIANDPLLKEANNKLAIYPWWPSAPGAAFNGMIAPISWYNIAGAIWYQGEGNTATPATYTHLFTSMIDAWRDAFHKSIPFYYVQIAPYKYDYTNVGALVQEAQAKAMTHPNVGMIVTTDIIDSVTNIHPGRKKPVGDRLANQALVKTYARNGIECESPSFKSLEVQKEKLLIHFTNSGGTMKSNDNIMGFFVSGEKEQWFAAEAKIEQDKIVVWSKEVMQPVHVRYGFGNTIVGNVSNAVGLPLIPFRTDAWPVSIEKVK